MKEYLMKDYLMTKRKVASTTAVHSDDADNACNAAV
jgi:hypothetical protein